MKSFELTQLAESDLFDIWNYTYEEWSRKQADSYIDALKAACMGIASGHSIYSPLQNIYPLLRSIRCKQHYIFYLHSSKVKPIIIAVLHERMNIIERLKGRLH